MSMIETETLPESTPKLDVRPAVFPPLDATMADGEKMTDVKSLPEKTAPTPVVPTAPVPADGPRPRPGGSHRVAPSVPITPAVGVSAVVRGRYPVRTSTPAAIPAPLIGPLLSPYAYRGMAVAAPIPSQDTPGMPVTGTVASNGSILQPMPGPSLYTRPYARGSAPAQPAPFGAPPAMAGLPEAWPAAWRGAYPGLRVAQSVPSLSPEDAAGVNWQPTGSPAVPGMGAADAAPIASVDAASATAQAALKEFARELGMRHMPSSLTSALLSETVREYGVAAIARPRDLRLAFIEQLLQRIPVLPLLAEGTALAGTYIVTGPPGGGKTATIATLARAAQRQKVDPIVLVNAQERRLGAAAAMEAIGAALQLPVVHAYTAADLQAALAPHGSSAVALIEADSLLPGETTAWPWATLAATTLVCLPAILQGDDARTLLERSTASGPARVAILTMEDLARNAMPALSALAETRMPVGLVAGDPFAPHQKERDLVAVARRALGIEGAAR